MLTFGFQRVLRSISFRNVDNAVNIERDFLGIGSPVLVTEAVSVFAVVLGKEGMIAIGNTPFVDLILVRGSVDLVKPRLAEYSGYHGWLGWRQARDQPRQLATYPEVNVEISRTAEFSVADLKGNGHLIILFQAFVETLHAMSWENNIVSNNSLER